MRRGILALLILFLAQLSLLNRGFASVHATFVSDIEPAQEGWHPGKGAEVVWNLEPQEFEPHRRPWAVRWSLDPVNQLWQPTGAASGAQKAGFRLKRLEVQFKAQPYLTRGERARWEPEMARAVKKLEAEARIQIEILSAEIGRISVEDVQAGQRRVQHSVALVEQRLRTQWLSSSSLTRAGEAELPLAQASRRPASEAAPSAIPADGALVNIPTQRWNGEPVIRATFDFSSASDRPSIRVTGLFLLDPNADRSLVAPEFLERAGVLVPVNSERWSGSELLKFRGRAALTSAVAVQKMALSGSDVAGVQRLWLFPTQIFSPPSSRLPCCDGVLGRDFFSQYRVSFTLPEHAPRELARTLLWPRSSARIEDLPEGWSVESVAWSASQSHWKSASGEFGPTRLWGASTVVDLPHGWIASSGLVKLSRSPAAASPMAKAIWRWREVLVPYVTSRGVTQTREERILEMSTGAGQREFRPVESIRSLNPEELDDSDVRDLMSGRFGSPDVRYSVPE